MCYHESMQTTAATIGILLLLAAFNPSTGENTSCPPTKPDMLGPFYKAGAPVRDRVGKGYILQGTVRSSKDCAPLARARIEFWLVGPDGRYDDDHRATVFSDKEGGYRFESDSPPPYSGRPPHIHIRVTAEGFKTLITQHYPVSGSRAAVFDLILVPESG